MSMDGLSSMLADWERDSFPAVEEGDGRPGGEGPPVQPFIRELSRWLDEEEQEPDEPLRQSFLNLSHSFRTRGLSASSALQALTTLEDILLESPLVGDGPDLPSRRARLRLALRGLLVDVVRMNSEMDARFARERADALAFFSEVLRHEVGNRLGAAQTAAQLLADPEIDVGAEREQSLFHLIREGVDSALTTVEDVSHLMASHGPAAPPTLELVQILDGVFRTVAPHARREGVRLERIGDCPPVMLDAARGRLVLTNLLLNGIRYSDPARETRWVQVDSTLSGDDGTLVIQVSDNGIGIRPEVQKAIFDYKVRSDAGRARSGNGSGLGLAVVAEAVAQLAGEVGVESTVGEGSSFTVRIPRSSLESADQPV
ncbi:MAG: HAMP domain-containing sensor histidine kinase [Gemmatimonadota bacterium]